MNEISNENLSSESSTDMAGEHMRDMLSGMHNWYACSHARPTYCNVCREALSGVTSHGLSCEVCKVKAHKRCAVRAMNNCKWTTLSSIGKDIIEEEDGVIAMPHQWLEGNLPVSAKCAVCDKTCGSVLRLQDWRCLWCREVVHSGCKAHYPAKCPLGHCRLSIIPPTALNSMSSDGYWQASKNGCGSPLLVFVNSKSGDNQGVKFLRRFKQLLNPAQVFDLMNDGPHIGLRLFQNFDTFRILVCGGDGSIGWVLSEIDKMELHKQCRIGVLPLGTGNDLARVLGWGTACDDDTNLQVILEKLEIASTKMLDRWSIWTQEIPMAHAEEVTPGEPVEGDNKMGEVGLDAESHREKEMISSYEDSVATHLAKILHSDENTEVISSAKVLCETVKDFVEKIGHAYEEGGSHSKDAQIMKEKCNLLNEKLNLLLQTLKVEAQATPLPPGSILPIITAAAAAAVTTTTTSSGGGVGTPPVLPRSPSFHGSEKHLEESQEKDVCESKDGAGDGDTLEQMTGPSTSSRVFKPRDALMSRANSLKKAVRQIIEQTEKAVDEQNAQTEEQEAKTIKAIAATAAAAISSATTATTQAPKPKVTIVTPSSDLEMSDQEDDNNQSTKVPESSESTKDDPQGSRSSPFSIYLSSTKAKIEKKKERIGLKSPRSPFRMRRISHGSTLSSHHGFGFGPVGVSQKFGSMENISILPGLDTLLGPSLGRTNPMLSKSIGTLAGGMGGAGIISKVLLANADALCAAASPLMDQDTDKVEGFSESCVMNNYFGIGLDAKITLDFHNKREEHPEKCSRTKNMMWYGMLGTKELVHRTYRNLEQKVQLECDGQRIPLPSLQGIVVLNIPSYMGGANFWGTTKEDETFTAPSFDDKILEVVAVFGGMQMAVSKLITLQHHRIAQCRVVKITILGEEGVPVQVDGEAWVQPPGLVKILHKNRAQMLVRDKQFESTLKSWTERRKIERPLQPLIDEEIEIVRHFCGTTSQLIDTIKIAAQHSSPIQSELLHKAMATAACQERLFSTERSTEGMSRKVLNEVVVSARNLFSESSLFMARKAYALRLPENILDALNHDINAVDNELRKVSTIEGAICYVEEEGHHHHAHIPVDVYRKHTKGKFKIPMVSRFKKPTKKDFKSSSSATGGLSVVKQWTVEEVGAWLEGLLLGEYKDQFIRNDIRGSELLSLERRDLKDIGVTKVGHIKRIQQAIKDLDKREVEPTVLEAGPSGSGAL
ncbi:diacylglycerol kinase delta-like isoform X2 [Lytechinus variegatus]|uniref:diacylglycerol kinase delta-like isoform X2 n=1 Tax=Lytechinus variegatus TaxID=7654 RepID=UPI001BB1A7D1|nr:diacylglycerol kinase delta-like isoform X2 [Lytechinus variegatus]